MKNVDFTKGSAAGALLRFFFPMLFSNILQQFYSFADMVIIAKGLGDNAVASAGNFTTFSFILTGFIMGITNGFSVNISQTCGEKNMNKLKKIIAASIKLSFIFAVLFSMSGLLLLRPVLQIMKTDAILMDDCLSYGSIIFSGLVITAAYDLLSAVLRAFGDSKTPLLAVGISSVINIILDILLIYLFELGVFAAAFATIFSQLCSVVICYFGSDRISGLNLSKSDFVSDFDLDINLLKNGLPMAFMNSVTSVGCIFVQSCINDYGAVYTSAYSACNKYLNLFMLPGITAGFAAAAFSGQNFGAGKPERIRSGTRSACIIALISAFLLGIILFIFSQPFAKLMLTEQDAVVYVSDYLKLLAFFIVLLNFLFVFRSSVQGFGRPFIPMCSGIIEMLIRIPAIYFGLPLFGFRAAVYAEGLAWAGALMLNVISYFYFIYRNKSRAGKH